MNKNLLIIILSLLTVGQAFSQANISGKVTNLSGDPVPGVNVIVKGSDVGTVTDVNGQYSLGNITKEATLIFSFVGMLTEEILVGEQTVIDVTLIEDLQSLNEVVVIGYGTVKKRDLTGSVVSLGSEEVMMAPTNNTMEALQGRIAGMDIMKTSGAVGSDVDILLRGERTIYGDNDPLFIIDGMPGRISELNPSDIESIDVLKDASSTAIYGSQGANGVVIITTKRGEEEKIKVNLDAYWGIGGKSYYLHGMKGDEYINYKREAYRTVNGNYPENLSQIFTDAAHLDAIKRDKWIDWVDEATEGNAMTEKYSISVADGSNKTKIYTSFNYNKEQGLISDENQKKYGLRLNMDREIAKQVKFGINLNLTYTNRNNRSNRVFKNSIRSLPFGDPYYENGDVRYNFINDEINPLVDQIKDQYVDNRRNMYSYSQAFIELTPLEGLSIRSRVGVKLAANRRGQFVGDSSLSDNIDGNAKPIAKVTNEYDYGYTWENIITYERTFADNHKVVITGITAWSVSEDEEYIPYSQGQEFASNAFYNLSSGDSENAIMPTSEFKRTQSNSYAGRINYSYRGKYLFTVTNRWDGSSKFAPGYKWDYFPSVAAAWRISDEGFMDFTESWLSNMKFRIGYGVAGNKGLDAYASQTNAIIYNRITIGGTNVSHVQYDGIYGNPAITWEKSYNRNIGFDLGLFKNRVDIAIDLYNTKTKGLLFKRRLAVTSGITAWGEALETWENIGETLNKGIEISINSRNIQTKEFKWTTNLSFTKNKEEVVKLPEGDLFDGNKILREGEPIWSFFDYKYNGIWSTEETDEAALYGAEPGDVKLVTIPIVTDTTNDQGVHEYGDVDRQLLGSDKPKWILGINNKFEFKGIDLSAFTMIRWGHMIESDLIGWYTASADNQPAGTDYWTEDNQGAYFPRAGVGIGTPPKGMEALRYIDGSYIKIKNITLGYTLSDKLLSKIYIQKLRLYVTAYNPIIFTKEEILKGTDPENMGSDNFPLYRTYVFGVNVTF